MSGGSLTSVEAIARPLEHASHTSRSLRTNAPRSCRELAVAEEGSATHHCEQTKLGSKTLGKVIKILKQSSHADLDSLSSLLSFFSP